MVVPNVVLSRAHVSQLAKAVYAADDISNVCSLETTIDRALLITVSDSYDTTALQIKIHPVVCNHQNGRVHLFTGILHGVLKNADTALPMVLHGETLQLLDPVTLLPLAANHSIVAHGYVNTIPSDLNAGASIVHVVPMLRSELHTNLINLCILSGIIDFEIDEKCVLRMSNFDKSFGGITITKQLNMLQQKPIFSTSIVIKFIKVIVSQVSRGSCPTVNVTCRSNGSVTIAADFGKDVLADMVMYKRRRQPVQRHVLEV